MNNLKKRCLTLLLSLAMIVTYMPTSMIAYAEADGETDPVQVEHQVEPEEPDAGVTSNDAVSEETQVEDDVKSEDAGSEDNAEDSKSEEAVSEEKGKDEASTEEESSEGTAKSAGEESKVDAKAEATEKEDFNEGKLSWNKGKYKVAVSYGADAKIPEDSTLELTEYAEGSDEYEDAKKELLKDDLGNSPFSEFDENATDKDLEDLGMAAFDLTIRDKAGNPIEPAPEAKVQVNVEFVELPEGADAKSLADSMEIQHLNENSGDVVVEKVATVDTEEAGKDDNVGEIAVNENTETAEVKFAVDGFSTFTITWRGGYRQVTVHYVDENGNELDIKNPDATHPNMNADSDSPAFLIYDIDGYEYDHTYRNRDSNRIAPILTKNNNNRWQYMGADNTSTTELSDGDNVYVVYKKKADPTTGGTAQIDDASSSDWPQDPATPQFYKSSTNNGNGTNTVSLSIKGGEKEYTKSTKANVIVVFDRSGSMKNNMAGTGWAGDDGNYYTGSGWFPQLITDTRLVHAKKAVNDMAAALLRDSEGVKMALVSFSTTGSIVQKFTDEYGTFTTAVNNISADGGTNWEQALTVANRMAVDSDAATYIVFVTDGDPTFRVSRGDVTNSDLVRSRPSGSTSNQPDMYDDYTFYYYRNNSVFGDGQHDYFGRNFSYAKDEVKSILGNNKSFYAIGVSNDVTKVQNLVTEAGGGKAYLASDETALEEAFEAITQSIKTTLGFGDVEITDGITELANVEMKVMQEVDPESFTYYKITSSGQTEWDPASEGAGLASYDKNSGAVTWDMGEGFQLEDGVTYMVTFRVWPSQAAYDLVADLNNGVKVYETGQSNSISAEERSQVVELAKPTATKQGSYALKTNTDTVNATYSQTSSTGGTVTVSGETGLTATYHKGDLENMALQSKLLTIRKIFDHSLDPKTVDSVTLKLQRKVNDDSHTMADYNVPGTESPLIRLGKDLNNWEYSFYVAPGFIADGEILEKGYQFTVVEPDLGENTVRYDLIPEIINPMVVDGDLQLIGDGDDNQALTAINRTRSAIEIHKTLYDVDGTTEIYPDTEFTITGQLLGPDGQPYTSQVPADPVAYYIYNRDGTPKSSERQHFPDSSDISFTLKAGEFLRFVNVPEGCTFEFQESSIPETYEFKSLAAAGRQRSEDDPAYTYSIILEDDVAHLVEGETTIATTDEGIIGNTNYKLDFYNKRVIPLPDVELVKVDQDDVTKKLNEAAFVLHKDSIDGDEVTVDGNGKEIHIVTGNKESSTGPDGWYDIGHLTEGTYYLVEVTEPVGYILNGKPVKIEVTRDDDVYSVTATQDGESVITGPSEDGVYTITVDNEKDTTHVSGTKTWEDGGDTSSRSSITVTVSAIIDGVKVANEYVVALAAGNGIDIVADEDDNGVWSFVIDGLRKYDSKGKLIVYEIAETAINDKPLDKNNHADGYEMTSETSTAEDGTAVIDITNTKLTEVQATKVWDDNDNQDGKREAVTFVLKADGNAVSGAEEKIIAPDATGTALTVKWDKLPAYKGGKKIVYTVEEKGVTDGKITMSGAEYTVTVTGDAEKGFTIKNSYTPEKTEATVKKVWDDANNQDGKRPTELKVTLSNGQEVTLKEGNGWTAKVENLPKYKDGKEIEYTWTEDEEGLPEGYSLTDTSTDGTVTTLTNSRTPEETTVTVKKVWNDADDNDGFRPDSVEVTLLAGGKQVTQEGIEATQTLKGTGWTYTWEGLDKYKDGKEIEYTVKETETGVITGTDGDGTYSIAYGKEEETGALTVTNKHTPFKITISGKKSWPESAFEQEREEGELTRPDTVTIILKVGGKEIKRTTATKQNNWAWSFENLDKYADGKEIKYVIAEDEVDGFISNVNPEDYTEVDVVNTPVDEEEVLHPTSIVLRKVDAFTGAEIPTEAEFELTKPDGAKETVKVTGNTTVSFEKDGKYTLSEKKAPTGYESTNLPSYEIKVKKELVEVKLNDKKTVWQWIYNLIAGSESEDFTTETAGDGTVTKTLTVPNTPAKQTVTVTKTYEGINKLPDDFKITVNYTAYEQEKGGTTPPLELTQDMDPTENVEISAVDGKITWTIKNVRYGTDFTATETGYKAQGYAVETKVAKSQTAAAGEERVITEGAVEETVEVPASNDAHIDFTNKYTCATLVIYKTIDKLVSYDADEEVKDATFTFRIVGKAKGQTVLNTVAAVMFNAETKTSSSVKIDKIPANIDELTVTEIDSGNYEWAKVKEEAVTEENCTKTWTVSFNNTQQNGDYESGAINRYKKDGTGYVKDEGGNASTQTEEGGAGDNGQN